ncbi:hypothetical protein SDC9_169540 [bioreactor metagenome]|uniref:Alpha-L-rhamnosidase C-terminal domain-containing protein n=1 Tax=bioreactor metagenome TaxID=1076179 RepID=A0A645G5G6_9ZZZZ
MVLETLSGGALVPISLSAMSYLIRVLTTLGPEARRQAAERLDKAFDGMVLSGASTLWETALGAKDFQDAGSLCHAWSSIDVYFAHAEVLGIKPLEPGFARFSVGPYPGHLFEASGSVVTPAGPITVEWVRKDGGLSIRITAPEQLRPELRPYPEVPILEVTYNGTRLTL